MPRWQYHRLSFNKPHSDTPIIAAKACHKHRPSPPSYSSNPLARLRAMNDALWCNVTRPTQHDVFSSQPDPFQASELLTALPKFNTNSNKSNQAMLFTSSQATSITPFVKARSGSCHESFTAMQQHTSAHQEQQTQQRSFQVSPPHLGEKQQHPWQLSHIAATTPDQLLAPQQKPEQHLKKPDLSFEQLATISPQLQKSMALGSKNTSQQFASQARTASPPRPRIANCSLSSLQTTPARQTYNPRTSSSKPVVIATYPQIRSADSVHAEAAYRNEATERTRLEQQRWQEVKRHYKRRVELKGDANALYHSYSEFLKYFPLGRGERASPYLVGLLANQPIPAEPTSDMGIAIQYAKRNWANFWEMGDLNYVVRKAKEELDKKMEERKMSGSTATAARIR